MQTNYQELAHAFERQEINPAEFRHADHVGVAYVLLRAQDFLSATFVYATTIRALATAAGADKKFNVTIAFAFISIIAERMSAATYKNYEEFISQNADLLDKDLLTRWYSGVRLQSDAARQAS